MTLIAQNIFKKLQPFQIIHETKTMRSKATFRDFVLVNQRTHPIMAFKSFHLLPTLMWVNWNAFFICTKLRSMYRMETFRLIISGSWEPKIACKHAKWVCLEGTLPGVALWDGHFERNERKWQRFEYKNREIDKIVTSSSFCSKVTPRALKCWTNSSSRWVAR